MLSWRLEFLTGHHETYWARLNGYDDVNTPSSRNRF